MTASEFLDLNNSTFHAHAAIGATLAMAQRLGVAAVEAKAREAQAALGTALERLSDLQQQERKQREMDLTRA